VIFGPKASLLCLWPLNAKERRLALRTAPDQPGRCIVVVKGFARRLLEAPKPAGDRGRPMATPRIFAAGAKVMLILGRAV